MWKKAPFVMISSTTRGAEVIHGIIARGQSKPGAWLVTMTTCQQSNALIWQLPEGVWPLTLLNEVTLGDVTRSTALIQIHLWAFQMLPLYGIMIVNDTMQQGSYALLYYKPFFFIHKFKELSRISLLFMNSPSLNIGSCSYILNLMKKFQSQ